MMLHEPALALAEKGQSCWPLEANSIRVKHAFPSLRTLTSPQGRDKVEEDA
jgi:hypothetical protein